MPEGDTVWLSARRMHAALAGQPLTRSDLRVPRLATVDLVGRSVLGVVSRGKHMLTRVEGDLTLHTHFGMEGTWRLVRTGHRPTGGPEHQIRAILGTERWTAVGYRLTVVELLATDDEQAAVGHLGPDLLGADWDPDEAARRLLDDGRRPIGEALLDQRNLAGIGNVYKSELLFLRGENPTTPVGSVRDVRALVELAHRVLAANRERWGHVTTGDTRSGRQHYVYGRAGEPCRRCGTTIRHATQGGPATERSTFWCPTCQPRDGDRLADAT
jgi:endonuclease-8